MKSKRSKLFNSSILLLSFIILISPAGCAGITDNTVISTFTSSPLSDTTTGSNNLSKQGYIHETDLNFNYTLEYPESWDVSAIDPRDIQILTVEKCTVKSETFTNNQDGTSLNLEIRMTNCYGHQNYVASYMPDVELYYFIILEENAVEVDGKEAEETIYKAPPLVTYQKCSRIVLKAGGWTYLFTYSAMSDQLFEANHHYFDDFLESFKTGSPTS